MKADFAAPHKPQLHRIAKDRTRALDGRAGSSPTPGSLPRRMMGPVFNKGPYTLMYAPLGKDGVEFEIPPGVKTNKAQRARLVAAVARLPVRADQVDAVDFCGTLIYWAVETQRVLTSKSKRRKPVAAVATLMSAVAYPMLTGLPVTRVSLEKKGERGQQEGGQFARFLAEVFQILGINASPSGQVRLLKKENREAETRNQLRPVIDAARDAKKAPISRSRAQGKSRRAR